MRRANHSRKRWPRLERNLDSPNFHSPRTRIHLRERVARDFQSIALYVVHRILAAASIDARPTPLTR